MSLAAGSTVHKIVQVEDEAKMDITNASASAHTLEAGMGYVVYQNTGSKSVWMGGSTVDADTSRGYKLLPSATWIFEAIKEQCKVYFHTASGETSQISIIKG